eukprot:CAMPEP_0184643592 /NCGR_PEP_ID=MMETSP0308-20130426/427_1 /TAXON_ID=38269 /ORGANISM="Gloeochaete witrockiana, Strain SAG 46.84" /LENGTH=196 /DNA_ID=CAMNT_0027071621 /DNA_START=235 /DNA_END=825 /DNA_ORIENTATION=-
MTRSSDNSAKPVAKLTFSEVLEKRHSGREYDASKPVKHDDILALCEAARSAPSCYNDQPWAFIIADRHADPAAFEKVFGCLVPFNQGWAKNVAVLIVIVGSTTSIQKEGPNRWGGYDTGAAAGFMALKAADLGLMAHQMGGYDSPKISAELSIPANYSTYAVMGVGYEKEGEPVPARNRRPLTVNFFGGKWGAPLK